MNRKLGRKMRVRKLAAFLLLLPLVSACSMKGSGTGTAAVDPPPSQEEEAMLDQAGDNLPAQASPNPAVPGDSVTVYLLDDKGHLAPMTLRLRAEAAASPESSQVAAETALTWLTTDPQRADQLPEGFATVIPQGAKLKSVKLDSKTGTAAVDFADPLPAVPAEKERKMIEALVWSMTELPGIDKVRLSIAGKPIRSLPASGLPVDEVLTRGMGINVEKAEGVHISRSMGVTLYFSARSAGGDGYFVPVTRLIDRTPDRMRAALEELIKGPNDSGDMQAVLTPDITIDKLSRMADTVNVALHEDGWSPDQSVPAQMMEALVLTMTEATGAPQVKVAMNGDDSFLDSDQRPYDHPVTRPVAVNMLDR